MTADTAFMALRTFFILAPTHAAGRRYERDLRQDGGLDDVRFVQVTREDDLRGRRIGLIDEVHVLPGFRDFLRAQADAFFSLLGFLEVSSGNRLIWKDHDRGFDLPPTLDRLTVERWLDS